MSSQFALPSAYTLLYLVNSVTWVLVTCFPVTLEHLSWFLSFWLYCTHVLIKCLYLVCSCYWYWLHATFGCCYLSSRQANINYIVISGPKIYVRYSDYISPEPCASAVILEFLLDVSSWATPFHCQRALAKSSLPRDSWDWEYHVPLSTCDRKSCCFFKCMLLRAYLKYLKKEKVGS